MKNKNVIFYLGLFILLVFIVYAYLEFNGIAFGKLDSDYMDQHSRFIDYLRQNFWKTHDIFPSVTMNYGGVQDFSNIYYHGYLNPYILISLLLPFVSTFMLLKLIQITVLILTYIFSSMVLRKIANLYNANKKYQELYIFLFATILAFSPQVIFHFSQHLMFLYYFPFFFLSLYGIIKIIENKSPILFVVTIGLIFYTNYFFCLVIGFMHLCFTGFYYYKISKSVHSQDIISVKALIIRMFISYIIGSLLGATILYPQLMNIFNGTRASNPLDFSKLFYFNYSIKNILLNGYNSQLGLFGVFAFVVWVLNIKKREILFLGIPILITISFTAFNYLLNIFQYMHAKAFYYVAPIIIIVIFIAVISNEFKYKKSAFIISIILMVIYLFSKDYFSLNSNFLESLNVMNQNKNLVLVYFVLQGIFLFIVIFSQNNSNLLSILFVSLLSISCVYANALIIKDKEYKKIVPKIDNNYYDEDIKNSFYRTFDILNANRAINHYDFKLYSSTINKDYNDFFNKFLLVQKTWADRVEHTDLKNNQLMMQIFGVQKNLVDKTANNTSPFIYGVENDNLYNSSSLESMDNLSRITSLATKDFVSEGLNKTSQNIEKYLIKTGDIKYIGNNKSKYNIGKNIRGQGVYYFELNALKPILNSARTICIKDHCSAFRRTNLYREKPVNKAVIMIDSNKFLEGADINFRIKRGVMSDSFSTYKFYFIPNSDIVNKKSYIKTTNNKVVPNQNFDFELNMNNNGYLITSIFYDKNYIVTIDGKKVENEKVNNSFLGAKLDKGQHHISIAYNDKNKLIGLILSTIGLILAIIMQLSYIKKKPKKSTENIQLQKIKIYD